MKLSLFFISVLTTFNAFAEHYYVPVVPVIPSYRYVVPAASRPFAPQIYCKENQNSGQYAPAYSDGNWVDSANSSSYSTCRNQIEQSSYGVYCRRYGKSTSYYAPAYTQTGNWIDNGNATDLSTCMSQISRARTGVYCRRDKNSGRYSTAAIRSGAWLNSAPTTSLATCLGQLPY